MTISIILVDDHEIFRQGLQLLLSIYPDFELMGQAANGLEGLALAERLLPNVVIVDMMMPGMSGLEMTTRLMQKLPDSRVVILSMHDDEFYVVNALKNGAYGYVLKDLMATDLAPAVRAAVEGERFLSQPLNRFAGGK